MFARLSGRSMDVHSPLDIFVDVDYTLLSASGSLRPHAASFFSCVRQSGHRLWVWSGTGIRQPEIESHGLGEYVTGYAIKPTYDYVDALRRTPAPTWPDLVVDDHEEIVRALGGAVVRPYFFTDERDTALRQVTDIILDFASKGHSDHPWFLPPPRQVR